MRNEPMMRRVLLYCLVTALLITGGALGVPADPSASHATPEGSARTDNSEGRVVVDAGPPSVPADGSFTIRTDVRVDEPTPYLEVRLQIHRPSGQLLFQRTEVRSDVVTGTVNAEFARELEDLSLAPDAYPFEIRVRTEVGEPREQVVGGHLLVHAPDPQVTPLAVIVRVAEMPGFDAAGNFVVDPGTTVVARDQVTLLAGAVIDDPRLRVTLGIPGMTIDSWSRAAEGYTFAGPEGLVEVDASAEVPRAYAETLELLSTAVATGRLELLDVPYADPDIGSLAQTRSLLDLGVHYEHSRAYYRSALGASPSAGTTVPDDALTPGALEVLKSRGISWALLRPNSLAVAEESTPTPGPWMIEGASVRALVLDTALSEALYSEESAATLMRVFERSISEEATASLVASVELGPKRDGAAEKVLGILSLLDRIPWAEPVTASEAAAIEPLGTAIPPETLQPASQPPAGYLTEVAEARRYATGFEIATGVGDEEALRITEASLLAQSARWAGPDGSWSQADRGRAFAAAAVREASALFDQVVLTARDVTLSGPTGDMPISIANDSTKELSVKLVVRTSDVHLPQGEKQSITLRPQENLHALRVDLRSSLSGRMEIELRAGEVVIDSATTTVRASYLDRLAIVGGVVILLIGVLLYIRKHVRAADAGSMPSDGQAPEGRMRR